MGGIAELGVDGHQGPGLAAGLLQEGGVAKEVGHAELGQPRLARAEELTGAAELKVDLGDAEAVLGGHQGVDALPGLLGEVPGVEQDAVGLPGTAADAPTQLVELGQAEALGVLDQHDRSVGHVDADLDHGGRDEEVDLAGLEPAHDGLLVLDAQSAVQEAHAEIGEDVAGEMASHVGSRFEIHGLRLLDQGIHDVDLAAFLHLLAQELVDLGPLALRAGHRLHRSPARRQLVEHAHVEIAVQGEGQRPRNGRRRHHQQVRVLALGLELGALGHSEAVLLIHHDQAQPAELHRFLHERVRADHAIHLTRGRLRHPRQRALAPSRDEVSSVTVTPRGSSNWRSVMKCCSARISVGAITAA